jgi:hypothetical protein
MRFPLTVIKPADVFMSKPQILPGCIPPLTDSYRVRDVRKKTLDISQCRQWSVRSVSEEKLESGRPMRTMTRRIKRELQPREVLIPSGMMPVMISYQSGPEIPVKPQNEKAEGNKEQ